MQIYIHIGLAQCGAPALQAALDDKRNHLISKGILYPRAPGRRNHTRLFMAASDPGHIEPMRWTRGYAEAEAQAGLASQLSDELASEITKAKPDKLIFSAEQFSASLANASELNRLHNLLKPFANEFRIVAHVDEQARLLARHYAAQIFEGRLNSLDVELAIAAQGGDWAAQCRGLSHEIHPLLNQMAETQAPPFWLDYEHLISLWENQFGAGSVSLRAYDAALFTSPDITREIREAFDISANIGKASAFSPTPQPSAAWLARCRELNRYFSQTLSAGRIIPRQTWRRLLNHTFIAGEPIKPCNLYKIPRRFVQMNQRLLRARPGFPKSCLKPERKAADWVEAAPGGGFRATQYMTVFLPMIDQTTRAEKSRHTAVAATPTHTDATPPAPKNGTALSDTAARLLPAPARANFIKLQHGRFAPHNNIGRANEEELAAAFTDAPKRRLAPGSSGNVIVACMKNEGPYIVEWVAYHRAIGVDNFLIYTNGCDDGTAQILERMQAMGLLQHRTNNDWRGKSPQQHALYQSLKVDLVKKSDWIIHIDVGEFINVRCGYG
ncbi:MAG: glycosyltransferase family 2 protein, partial [Paracoccaceae bacterium]